MDGDGDSITYQEIIDLVRTEFTKSRPQREPGDVTVAELVQITGIPQMTIRNHLEKEVRSGHLIRIPTVENGHRVSLYRKANHAEH